MFHLELLVAEILRVEASSVRFLSVDRKRLVLVSSDTALVYCDCKECRKEKNVWYEKINMLNLTGPTVPS